MALPLNLNTKNVPNADVFLEFKIYVYFLWERVSGLQLQTSTKIIQFWKKRDTKFGFELWSNSQVHFELDKNAWMWPVFRNYCS